jgi:transposase InsO family protein
MKSLVALSTITSSVDVWHRCLGHPSHKSLAHLISKFDFPTTNKHSVTTSCESCQKGKHVRLPFSNSVSFTYFPFQLIQCDLWASPVESFTGYKYYLIVIDDFSHYTWAFPLRHKSDACIQLIDFYSFALNQFHLSIQCVQCDNGKEFDNNVLRSFLSSKGVVLRLSYPHTSSQNGKAERGIRSINNITQHLAFPSQFKASLLG